MSLLTPEQIAQLASNGLSPDVDHKPVINLQTKFNGEVIGGFLLTHVNPDYEHEAFGLIDLGTGKPRPSTIFLNKSRSYYAEYDYHVEQKTDLNAEYPISVYAEAA